MAWEQEHQIRAQVQCSTCPNVRFVTVLGKNEADCVAQLNHERREGHCFSCDANCSEEAFEAAKLRFGKCNRCGKVMPIGALLQHKADHARDDRTFRRSPAWQVKLPKYPRL